MVEQTKLYMMKFNIKHKLLGLLIVFIVSTTCYGQFLITATSNIVSETYYVSNDGSDSDDGLTPETAWETATKINSFAFNPGDSVLFASDDTFRLTTPILLTASGLAGSPIVLSKYGTGAKPFITAQNYESSDYTWTDKGGGLYGAPFNLDPTVIMNVSEDGVPLMRMTSGNGNVSDIVAAGQWVPKASVDTLYVRTTEGVDPSTVNVEFGTMWGAFLNGTTWNNAEDYITVDNLELQGGFYTIEVWGNNITIQNCDISNSFAEGIKLEGSEPTDNDEPFGNFPYNLTGIQVLNNDVSNFGRIGIDNTGPDSTIISGNAVHNNVPTYGYNQNPEAASGIIFKNNSVAITAKNNHIYDMIVNYSGAFTIGGQTWESGINDEAVNCVVSYNVIENITTSNDPNEGGYLYGGLILMMGAKQCTVANNTIVNNTMLETYNSISGLILFSRSDYNEVTYLTEDPVIYNNIFYDNYIADNGNVIEELYNGSVSGLVMDYNLFQESTGDVLENNLISDQDAYFESTISENYADYGVTMEISTDSHSGDGSLLLIADDNGSQDRTGYVVSGMVVDTVYYFEFWAKAPTVNDQTVNSDFGTSTINSLDGFPTTQWAKYSETFTSTAASEYLRFYAAYSGSIGDSLLVDDIYIGKLSDVTFDTVARKFNYEGDLYQTVTDWQGAGFDTNSQEGDPLFTTEYTDLSLQVGSPAINAGTDVGLTHDILGNPIVGLPDIGAYEKQ